MIDPNSPEPVSGRLQFSPEALFRYQVVSQVVAGVRAGKRFRQVVKGVAARPHLTWDGKYQLRKVSRRSVYRWHAAFIAGGADALEPAERARCISLVLPEALLDFLRTERGLDPEASVPELLRRARVRGFLEGDDPDRVTVWRAMTRMGLPATRRAQNRDRDMRSFAYPHRMMMILGDGKHFRAGPGRTRRLALFFIDDATRYVPFAVVGTDECTELFLRGLYELICHIGFMDIIFLDNGPGFISDDTVAVCARLGIQLINGTAGYPEGRGKIERFNQTVQQDILRSLTSPDISDEPAALALRINHYLAEQYNQRAHEGIDGDAPSKRWDGDERPLRFPSDDAALRERFVLTETRKVTNDNLISFETTRYEVPRGHAGTKIQVFRQTLDGTLRILHDGKLIRLHPVDREANARARRARPEPTPVENSSPPPRTAALIAFDRDYGPVVATTGALPPDHQEE